jgi:hypothetical protein
MYIALGVFFREFSLNPFFLYTYFGKCERSEVISHKLSIGPENRLTKMLHCADKT